MSRFPLCILVAILSGGVPIAAQELPWIKSHAYARIKIDLNNYLLAGGAADLGGGMGGIDPSGGGGFAGGEGGSEGGGYMGGGTGQIGPMPGEGEPTVKPKKEEPIYFYVNVSVGERIDDLVTGNWIIKHKWGKTWVPKDDIHIVKYQSVRERYEGEQNRFLKSNKSALDFLHLARFALRRGLIREFESTMQEMVIKVPGHPATKAFIAVRDKLKKAPNEVDPSARELLARVRQSGVSQQIVSKQSHYMMLNKLRDGGKEAKARLEDMERTYATFFYWWALDGVVLDPPEYQLVVVLDNDAKQYRATFFDLVGELPVEDGFTVRRANVAYLSYLPLSNNYRVLAKNNAEDLARVKKSYDDLLDGGTFAWKDIKDVPKLQTRSLVQKIIEEETAAANCTKEAINQLLSATELLPQNITTAQWFRYGLSRFFATPNEACFPGSGLPDWSHLIEFQVMKAKGTIRTKKADAFLLRIITDQHFHDAQRAWRLAEITHQYKHAQQQQTIAETTAWALTYYLMQSHPQQVMAYMKELGTLPRDVEYDSRVLASSFARAFGMTNKTGEFPIDLTKLSRLGTSVLNAMQAETLDVSPLHYPVYEEQLQARKK